MEGLGKKKLQRKVKQAEKKAGKVETQGVSSAPAAAAAIPYDDWFAVLKAGILERGKSGQMMHSLLRNTVRLTVAKQAAKFGALPLLLGKNLVFIEFVVSDTDRSIQEKLYMTGSKVQPNAVDITSRSRRLFRDAVPYLLKNTEQWFFSRSLVFKGFNGVIGEAVKFPSREHIGRLLDLDLDASDGIRSAEVFLFVAGDFEVNEEGLCSRDAVKELLHGLNSKRGLSKVLCFDVVAASVLVPKAKEMLEDIDMHVNLTA